MTMVVTGPAAVFDVTFFKTYAASQKTCGQHSLITLAALIKTTTASEKKGLPWLKLATFGDTKTPLVLSADGGGRKTGGSLRHDANVLTVTGIEADYDAEQVSFDEVVQRLIGQGVLSIVYTSPSHTEDRQRWRVLCPFTTSAGPEVRTAMLGRLNGLCRGIFSVESWTLSQSYFYGSIGSNPCHKVEVIDGTPIDQHGELDEIWQGKANTASAAPGSARNKPCPVNEIGLLEQIINGESYHTAAIRLLGKWAIDRVPLMEARTRLVTAMEAVVPPDRDVRWQARYADIDRCVLDIYGKEAEKRDRDGDWHSVIKQRADGSPEDRTSRKAGHTGSSGVTWSEPVDFLTENAASPPSLKEHHVPAPLWPFISDVAARMGVDPASVALAALVSCAAVISDEWRVQPKRHDDTWTEQARLWGAILGEPSILKTPIIAACTKPIDRLEADARRRHIEETRQWKADCETAKLDKKPPPIQPKLDRYMVEGITPEALSEVLRDDDEAKMHAPLGKVLSRHDEMSEFFGGLDRYKAGGRGGSERGAYLRLFNGGRYTIDRIGRGSFAVSNWSACFLGGCQPGPIQRIARDAAEDGLLQRFLYAVPGGQEPGLDRRPDHDAALRYSTVLCTLAALRPEAKEGCDHVEPIELAVDAHACRERINKLASTMAMMPDTSKRLEAAFGKWPGLFGRLCLTFHMVELADARYNNLPWKSHRAISAETAERVARYMQDIILPHLLRADAVMFSTDQTGHARWVAGYILAHGLERIGTRDLMRSYKAFKSPEASREMMAVMQALVAVGWLEPEEPTNAAKPVTNWTVNPAVPTLFAARATAEKARRQLIRLQVCETMQSLGRPQPHEKAVAAGDKP